jgi:hypothetical protein
VSYRGCNPGYPSGALWAGLPVFARTIAYQSRKDTHNAFLDHPLTGGQSWGTVASKRSAPCRIAYDA